MKVLYVSNLCSEEEYNRLFSGSKVLVSQQSQRFNRLMAEGFALNGCEVQVVSGRPVSSIQKQKVFKHKDETVNNVNYHYLGFLNFKFIRNILLSIKAKKFAKKWCKNNPDGVMFCDALNLSVASAISKVFRKKNMKVITCITDLPEDLMMGANKLKSTIFTRFFKKVTKCSTHYVLLSKYMSESPNLFERPSIVVEGISDDSLSRIASVPAKKGKKIIMYAGLLYKKYGVGNLLNGFIKAKISDYEMHFYGIGNKHDENDDVLKDIIEASQKHDNIKYCGSVSSRECFEKEMQATLLVNPRPTNERFVRNSFPSKNIEYMSSGTPLLTTNLPSMPEEYKDYCYIIEDETEDGVCNVLKKITSLKIDELERMGKKGRDFILNQKNNKFQTKRIIDFIKE